VLDDAWQVVRNKAAQAMAPGAGLTSSNGNSEAAAARIQQEQRAAGSKVMEKVMKLTGLKPVKELMLSLREQVSGINAVVITSAPEQFVNAAS
jgi:hypothetical protein